MGVEMTNGSSVSRIYSDGSGDLLAVFQYDGDARDFAEQQVEQDAKRSFYGALYVVANCYNGKVSVHRGPVES